MGKFLLATLILCEGFCLSAVAAPTEDLCVRLLEQSSIPEVALFADKLVKGSFSADDLKKMRNQLPGLPRSQTEVVLSQNSPNSVSVTAPKATKMDMFKVGRQPYNRNDDPATLEVFDHPERSESELIVRSKTFDVRYVFSRKGGACVPLFMYSKKEGKPLYSVELDTQYCVDTEKFRKANKIVPMVMGFYISCEKDKNCRAQAEKIYMDKYVNRPQSSMKGSNPKLEIEALPKPFQKASEIDASKKDGCLGILRDASQKLQQPKAEGTDGLTGENAG